MAKTLSKDKAQLVQEYAYYVGLHSQAETYVLFSIRADKERYIAAESSYTKDNIIYAKECAERALTAARCLGLSEEFISNALLNRANANGTEEA